MADKNCLGLYMEESFFGTSTMSDRGQIVIPVEARTALGFNPGDKLMMMRHPVHKGLVVFKLDSVREFFAEVQASLDRLEESSKAEE